MNIQPSHSPLTPKLDERAAPVAGQSGVPASTARTEPPASPPSREDVSTAVKKLNEAMPASSQSLEFSIDDDSKEIVVKLIDQDTKEVVRQIPSEEALQIAKSIDKMQGLLIRQTA
ncbi:flagellar protein FlaG [Massilia niastensis]|uniref:flagellar protein FlaG n=1 Tax=Massilia niastensis TaxID=544911 RepID=UPI00036A5A8E|nr:flagellar protein FlaG [Massilia niastensis]